jgi:hypothetical protein
MVQTNRSALSALAPLLQRRLGTSGLGEEVAAPVEADGAEDQGGSGPDPALAGAVDSAVDGKEEQHDRKAELESVAQPGDEAAHRSGSLRFGFGLGIGAVDVVERQIDVFALREFDQFRGHGWQQSLSALQGGDVALSAADPIGKHLLRHAKALADGFQVVHSLNYKRRNYIWSIAPQLIG